MRIGNTPEVRRLGEKINRQLRTLAAPAGRSPYWVYAIRDPLTGDRRDHTTGDPVYVGQTADPVRRAGQHMVAAGQASEGGAPRLYRRLHGILVAGRVPVFNLLEPAPTRLAALRAETEWIQHLTSDGFTLLNEWREHQPERLSGTRPPKVPLLRLWSLTLDEARVAGVGLRISCAPCGLRVPLPLPELIRRSRPGLPLYRVRLEVECPGCGRKPCLAIGGHSGDACEPMSPHEVPHVAQTS